MLLCVAAAAGTETIPDQLQRIMDGHHIPVSDVGIYVQEIGSDQPLLSINPDTARNPASTMKLVTTLAALEILGPAYTWPTEVYTMGPVKGGVLNGDLLIKGYGDPYMATEEFWKMLEEIQRLGVEKINGDLVIDSSYFTPPDEDPGAFDHRPFRAYNVLPNAFLVNFKAVYFHFYPGPGTHAVEIRTDPELPNLAIENRLRQVGGRCGGFQRGISVSITDPVRADHVIFEGRYPRACGHYVFSSTVLTPKTFAFGVFKSLWEELGGSVSGEVRSGTAPTGVKPLLTWRSRPLGEIIRMVNKFSNNVMCRELLLTLAAVQNGPPGTVAKGTAAIDDYLTHIGLDPSQLRLVNGAGLSRDARVSPRLLAGLLAHARRSPYMPEFISSLPIIGMDGTTRTRLSGRREAGHAHVKTGTMDDVAAIAGYVVSQSGREFIVVGIVNHRAAHRGPGEELWNALIKWTFAQ